MSYEKRIGWFSLRSERARSVGVALLVSRIGQCQTGRWRKDRQCYALEENHGAAVELQILNRHLRVWFTTPWREIPEEPNEAGADPEGT